MAIGGSDESSLANTEDEALHNFAALYPAGNVQLRPDRVALMNSRDNQKVGMPNRFELCNEVDALLKVSMQVLIIIWCFKKRISDSAVGRL